MTTTTPLVEDFRNPLLLAMARLAKFQADVVVLMVDVYAPVMALMSINSIDKYGEKTGSSVVPKLIQQANKAARKEGLTSAPQGTRGKWTLTNAGLNEARTIAEAMGVSTPTPEVITLTPTIDGGHQDDSGYHPDPYIRGLAIDQTPCFGNFSAHGAAICTQCSLALECHARQSTEYGILAKAFGDATGESEFEGMGSPAMPGQSGQDTIAERFRSIDFSLVDIIVNKAEAVCAACKGTIQRDERCRWVEEMPDTDDGGLFHMACSGGE